MDVSSGVREIKYQINGGPIESIEGDYGYFLLTQEHDGKDVLVEYWAIDNVGNEEAQHNTFTIDMDTIDMDQTEPTINLMYEVTGGNPIVGWTILFTATGDDATSGMDRVEFYLNYLLQKVVSGSGPTYEWEFIYHGGLNLVITVWGYDIAGNMAIDEIDKVTNNFNQNTQLQLLSIPSSNIYYSPQQRLIVNPGGV
jgi:hypothetical protein